MRKLCSLFLALLLTVCVVFQTLPQSSATRIVGTGRTAMAPSLEKPEEEQLASRRMEAALEWALTTAADDSHGYSQAYRYGPSYDCASFVTAALIAGGFQLNEGLTTYTMKSALEEVGFTAYRKGEVEPRRGDILLDTVSHVEICMGGTDCVAAHQDYDWRSGDSTGKEIEYRCGTCWFCIYQQYTWILRYEGADPVEPRGHAVDERETR